MLNKKVVGGLHASCGSSAAREPYGETGEGLQTQVWRHPQSLLSSGFSFFVFAGVVGNRKLLAKSPSQRTQYNTVD